jgi:hypothetical protein
MSFDTYIILKRRKLADLLEILFRGKLMKHSLLLLLLITSIACNPQNQKDKNPDIVDANSMSATDDYNENDYIEGDYTEDDHSPEIDIQCDTNLLINGDFEEMNEATGYIFEHRINDLASSSLWDVYSSLPGWEVFSGAGIEVQAGTVVNASSGKHYVELDSHSNIGESTNSRMGQGVYLTPGSYSLKFMYRARTTKTLDNDINVYLDDDIIKEVSSTNTSGWQKIEVPMQIQEDGNYNISFEAAGIDNTYGGFIDDISLIQSCVNED